MKRLKRKAQDRIRRKNQKLREGGKKKKTYSHLELQMRGEIKDKVNPVRKLPNQVL